MQLERRLSKVKEISAIFSYGGIDAEVPVAKRKLIMAASTPFLFPSWLTALT